VVYKRETAKFSSSVKNRNESKKVTVGMNTEDRLSDNWAGRNKL